MILRSLGGGCILKKNNYENDTISSRVLDDYLIAWGFVLRLHMYDDR